MFSKLFVAASVALLAVATPTPGGGEHGGSGAACSTNGNAQCCNSLAKNSGEATSVLGPTVIAALLAAGLNLVDLVDVGIGCTPIAVGSFFPLC